MIRIFLLVLPVLSLSGPGSSDALVPFTPFVVPSKILPSSAQAQSQAQLKLSGIISALSRHPPGHPSGHPPIHPPAGIVDLQLHLTRYTYN